MDIFLLSRVTDNVSLNETVAVTNIPEGVRTTLGRESHIFNHLALRSKESVHQTRRKSTILMKNVYSWKENKRIPFTLCHDAAKIFW